MDLAAQDLFSALGFERSVEVSGLKLGMLFERLCTLTQEGGAGRTEGQLGGAEAV